MLREAGSLALPMLKNRTNGERARYSADLDVASHASRMLKRSLDKSIAARCKDADLRHVFSTSVRVDWLDPTHQTACISVARRRGFMQNALKNDYAVGVDLICFIRLFDVSRRFLRQEVSQ